MTNLLGSLKSKSHTFWVITGLICVALVGAGDYLTGREIAFSLFYLIPIVLVTWYAGRKFGLIISLASAVAWFGADTLAGQVYLSSVIPFWNAAVRLSFFFVVAFLLSALKGLEQERLAARQDDLTGAANRRHFFEVVQAELERSQRYQRPFSVLYFDIDGFKDINDQWGHQVGDHLLCALVNRARRHLRKTDFLARLGGDEFIILLPETGPEAAQAAATKMQAALLDEMQSHNWPVTFSIGTLTCLEGRLTPDELIVKADDLMYSIKKNGKSGIAYGIVGG